jgi:hypothetical protein
VSTQSVVSQVVLGIVCLCRIAWSCGFYSAVMIETSSMVYIPHLS